MRVAKLLEDLIEAEKNCKKFQFKQRNQEVISDFIEFFKSNNKDFIDLLEIKRVNHNELGLFANKNYGKDDLIFEIPKSLMITLEDAIYSPIGKTNFNFFI